MKRSAEGQAKIKKNLKVFLFFTLYLVIFRMLLMLTGCALMDSKMSDLKGQLTGISFTCRFYDNNGGLFLTAKGEKVGMNGNIVKEATVTDYGSFSTAYGLSSVVTINIDGDQIQSCGSTVIFEETGLEPDVDFQLEDINSSSDGFSDIVFISGIVNKYKNAFGKGRVVVIQSQLGVPICAYSGDEVYWEIKDDLPKTTKLMVDGKALYIHRANFEIIDKDLIQ